MCISVVFSIFVVTLSSPLSNSPVCLLDPGWCDHGDTPSPGGRGVCQSQGCNGQTLGLGAGGAGSGGAKGGACSVPRVGSHPGATRGPGNCGPGPQPSHPITLSHVTPQQWPPGSGGRSVLGLPCLLCLRGYKRLVERRG